jgi:HD superfamily phosphodiesterase
MRYYGDVRMSEHSIKAYAYANSIGEGENLPENEQLILSAAAILHDIGIPRAIELHGSAKGEYQEKEGALLVPEMLAQAGVQENITERVAWLVGHHHTEALAESDLLLQILMEGDYLVNLAEGNAPAERAAKVRDGFFKTATGKQYITALFNL